MNILLFGKGGQVGWELQRSLSVLGHVTALDFDSQDHCGDFSNPDGIVQAVRALRPDVIVNAAAHTAVDKAESEPELAQLLNATTPGVLAEEAARSRAWLVHYSTDYVFHGHGQRPWAEDDPTGPLNVYGQTKLAGEQAIVQAGCRHLILRTSWVYAARGGNFARTMLRLARQQPRLTVIDDQWGAPTGAELIADVSAHAIVQLRARPDKAGIYHLAAAGETNWFSYAKHVLAQAQSAQAAIEYAVKDILPIPSSAYPVAATRPHNSRLDTRKLRTAFDLHLPPWQAGVDRMLAEILGHSLA